MEAEETGTSVDKQDSPRQVGKDEMAQTTSHQVLFGKLPRYRPYLVADHFAYYAVGHDVAQSSLSGMLVTPVVDGTETRDGEAARCIQLNHVGYDSGGDQLLTLDTMTDNERKQMNFFYGGCGDCRHVYTTLYDLGRQLTEGDDRVKRGNRVHFFLNDTSPAILARCSVLLVALSDLSRFPADVIRDRSNEEVKLLLSFLHFVFVSPVVPCYVHERLVSIINRLLGDRDLYPSLMIRDDTWPGVKGVLGDWLTAFDGLSHERRSRMAQHSANHFYLKHATNEEKAKPHVVYSNQRKLNKQVRNTGTFDVDRADTQTRNKLFQMVNTTATTLTAFTTSNLLPLNVHLDIVFAAVHRVLPPPRCMLRHHSSEVRQLYAKLVNPEEFKVARQDISNGAARQIGRLINDDNNPMLVFQDYLPNLTGYDTTVCDDLNITYQGHSGGHKNFLKPIQWSPLAIISRLYASAVIEPPCTTPATLFDLTSNLWENAAIAFQHLLAEPTSSLRFELMGGDMNLDAHRLAFEEQQRASQGLPSRFMRAFVSNCPDYTGILYPLIDIVPRLLPSPTSFLRWNVLYPGERWCNPGQWLDVMLPVARREDILNLFGVSLSTKSQFKTFLWLGKENAQLPDRDTVRHTLLRVFIAIAFPHSQKEGRRSIFPETMVAFMELMVFLLEKGVNNHWISDAINEIFLTRVVIDNPRPPRTTDDLLEKPGVSPTAFVLELRTLLAVYQPVLKLNLSPLLRIAHDTTVKLRSVKIPNGIRLDVQEHAGLVLYSNAFTGLNVRGLALIQPEQQGEVHFFSAIRWERARSTVGFYLSDEDYEMIRQRDWKLLLFSSQSYEALTAPTRPVWQ